MKLFALLLIFAFAQTAVAFPEMVRHGYVNCVACHISPSGGGVLTEYGRNLSKELLSRWSAAGEENFLEGAVDTKKIADWLLLGGDVRTVQVHQENDLEKTERYITMQAGIETAVNTDRFAVDVFTGEYDQNGRNWKPYAPRYYAMYRLPNDVDSVRVGRFVPAFGLNIPEHISPTRGALGFGIGAERDTAEVQRTGEDWNVNFSSSQSPGTWTNPENGLSLQVQRALENKHKIGVSYWTGSFKDDSSREILGVHGIFGFSPEWFLLAEWDRQSFKASSGSNPVTSTYAWHKLGWEFTRGVQALALVDWMQADTTEPKSTVLHYGLGGAFYPRPHMEFTATWTRERNRAVTETEGDYAWLMLHYYF